MKVEKYSGLEHDRQIVYHAVPLVMLRRGGWKICRTQPKRCWNEML